MTVPIPSFVVQRLITYIMEKGILQTRKIIKNSFLFVLIDA